jgi:serine/threonine-protein kinase
MRLSLIGDHHANTVLATPANERNAVVSPDGQWLAYESDSSGSFEIYVRPFPQADAGPRQVSPAGGTKPLWARSGKQLFYISPDSALMQVPVETTGSAWNNGAAAKVLDLRATVSSIGIYRTYDVSPDGKRFLIVRAANDQAGASAQVVVVQHFDEELKRLVSTK